MISDMLNAVRDLLDPAVLPTYRHLAQQANAPKPYIILNVVPGEIFRCFVDAESFQRNTLEVTLWYWWEQDDTAALVASRAVEAALDMVTAGGILLRLERTPGLYVRDADKGRRALAIVHTYIFEEIRT